MGCGASSAASDAELAMRKEVMKAARANDLAAMQRAIQALEKNFNDADKTASAFEMWDPQDKGYDSPQDPGPNPDGAGVRFMMPLKWAAYHGNADMCRLIVEHGGEVDSTGFFCPWKDHKFVADGGVPALGFAAMKGHLDAAKYLVNVGANVNYVDTYGNTAADLAGKGGHSAVQSYLWAKMKKSKA